MIEALEKMISQAREVIKLINTFNEVDAPLSDNEQVCMNAIQDAAERILTMMQEYSLEVQKEDVNEQELGYLVFDLRNPVNNILIASEFLLETNSETQIANLVEEQRKLVEAIHNIAEPMSENLFSIREKQLKNWPPNQDNPA
jgi:signal transduction histidine kinase